MTQGGCVEHLDSSSLLRRCQAFLRALPASAKYERKDLLVPDLLAAQDGSLRVFYAPLDWANTAARVVLLGITPGWTQMEIACRSARAALADGASPEEACRTAKSQASFAGTMRAHLTHMLDALDLPELLGIRSSSELFGSERSLLHTTSVVRYPVFVGTEGKNYAGTGPRLAGSPFLMSFARDLLAPELESVLNAVIIPFGKRVEEALQLLAADGRIRADRWLSGFPHASGGNGHRVRLYARNKESLTQQLRRVLRA